jgi:rubrerythrin
MKSGCPFCAPNGLVIKGETDLLTVYPEIAAEWDFSRNKQKPDEYRPYSNKSVYWLCPICGSSYPQKIHNRTLNGFGCSHCMRESHTSFQEQSINYYLSQVTNVENRANVHGFELDIFLTDLGMGIEYNGEYFHQNKQMSDSRKLHQLSQAGVRVIVIDCGRFREKDGDHLTLETKKMGNPSESELKWCLNEIFALLELPIPDINLHRDRVAIYKQYISAIKANSLAEKYPSIAQEWDCDQNHGLSPAAFSYGSQKTVWWKCPTCHLSYDMKIYNRTSGKQNCPYCSGKRIAEGYNDLATTHPKLVKEWDFLANEYPPQRYTHGSNYKAAWVCQDCGYHWRSAIYSRAQGKNCPACAGKVLIPGRNDFAAKHATLLSLWDYEKNERTPADYFEHSNKQVWWKCDQCGYEWKTTINSIVAGRRCSKCAKQRRVITRKKTMQTKTNSHNIPVEQTEDI